MNKIANSISCIAAGILIIMIMRIGVATAAGNTFTSLMEVTSSSAMSTPSASTNSEKQVSTETTYKSDDGATMVIDVYNDGSKKITFTNEDGDVSVKEYKSTEAGWFSSSYWKYVSSTNSDTAEGSVSASINTSTAAGPVAASSGQFSTFSPGMLSGGDSGSGFVELPAVKTKNSGFSAARTGSADGQFNAFSAGLTSGAAGKSNSGSFSTFGAEMTAGSIGSSTYANFSTFNTRLMASAAGTGTASSGGRFTTFSSTFSSGGSTYGDFTALPIGEEWASEANRLDW